MFVSYDKNNIITAISETSFSVSGQKVVKFDFPKNTNGKSLIGKKLSPKNKKEIKDLRVAVVCNWGDNCGIATYSKFLLDKIKTRVKDLHIFAEIIPEPFPKDNNITYCWQRGQSTNILITKLKEYNPDFIIIQHEFGIFPKAGYFLQFLQAIDEYPYVLTLHSVYEHLDKSVCTSAIKNIIVHTKEGMDILKQTGNNNNIFIIPHGCTKIQDKGELWNIFQTPYTIVQFGFGFYYKGVDTVLEAISILKSKFKDKYKEIFYCYLCSENGHSNAIHTNYYNFLIDKIKELNIEDNVAIIRKFQTEQTINHYLRTAKLAVFPYRSDPNNIVYGASGATRIAMANDCPTICGKNHQFDDLEGIVPRIQTSEELAIEVDKIFSNNDYRQSIINKSRKYIEDNTWDKTADRYLNLYDKIFSITFPEII